MFSRTHTWSSPFLKSKAGVPNGVGTDPLGVAGKGRGSLQRENEKKGSAGVRWGSLGSERDSRFLTINWCKGSLFIQHFKGQTLEN